MNQLRNLIINYVGVFSALLGVVAFGIPDVPLWGRVAVLGFAAALLLGIVIWKRSTVYGLRDWANAEASASLLSETFHIDHTPTEGIAKQGNDDVQRAFGKGTITYETYEHWRRKNPFIFSVVKSGNGKFIGFFDIFPLGERLGRRLLKGEFQESDIGIDDILSPEEDETSDLVYIATVFCRINDDRDVFICRQKVMLALVSFVIGRYPPREGRRYAAFAYTPEGRRALENNGFTLYLTKKQTTQNADLYTLDAQKAAEMANVFERFVNEFGRHSRAAPVPQPVIAAPASTALAPPTAES